MFDSTVLEVIAGLVFVFLFVSLICSAIGDKISDLLKWRATQLERGIREFILGGQTNKEKKNYTAEVVQEKDIKELKGPEAKISGTEMLSGAMLKELYEHPLIKSLGPNGSGKPINIPPQIFVAALFDVFVPSVAGKTKVGEVRAAIEANLAKESPLYKPLLALFTGADEKIEDARKNVENWFDAAMEQTTIIYKRNMWWLALCFGIITSIVLNTDSIAITSALWHEPVLRASVSATATEYIATANQQTTKDQTTRIENVLTELNKLKLPIGWQLEFAPTFVLYPNDFVPSPQPITRWILKILGWLITGFAAAQGAPFWFDTLQKITGQNGTSSKGSSSAQNQK